jgi:phage gpG-like protein
MFSLEVDGADVVDAQLANLPTTVQAALQAKAAALAVALTAHVVDDKLSGQVLAVKSGLLRASIASQVEVDGDVVRARVFVGPGVKYAAIQEFGGRTAAHDIVPDKARALSFVAGGARIFARIVHHPGSTLPERSYLRSSLADMAGEIADGLKAAALEAAAATDPGGSP